MCRTSLRTRFLREPARTKLGCNSRAVQRSHVPAGDHPTPAGSLALMCHSGRESACEA